MAKSTGELLDQLKKTSDFSAYTEQNSEDFIEQLPLHTYLSNILIQKYLKKSVVIHDSGLDRGYAYDIFSGSKQPSRDKLLALCFCMQLTVDEVQRLLNSTGYPQLYARIERDSVIIFALQHHASLSDTNELLFEMGYPLLE